MFTRGIVESVRRHKKPIVLLLLSFVLYTCVALVLTYPLIRNVSHYYFSPELESPRASGDGIGTIAGTWQAAHAGKQDAMGKATGSASYPFKMNSGGASYPLSSGILVLLARLIGAQASFNILMLLSFPLAGAIMFMLVFYVTHSGAASLLSGFLYAFSPWHTSRTFDHISLTAVHCLPLFVLALVAFWKRRDLVSAVALAGASIVAALTDLHFGLFCAVMALTWSLALYISYLAHGREGPPFPSSKSTTHIRVALLVLLAVVIAASVSIPVYRDLFYKDPAVMPGGEGRGIKQSVANSAKPADYFIPPRTVSCGEDSQIASSRTGPGERVPPSRRPCTRASSHSSWPPMR